MNRRIVTRRVAREEFDRAVDWYEQRRRGGGAAFSHAVRHLLDEIVAQPTRYPIACDDIREAAISGYPYCVYYRLTSSRVVVVAVFHNSRDPAVWQSRN